MKYFVTSDLHSHLTPLLAALQKAEYDKDNENHTLIVDGDLFDRGDETLELFDWLMSIPRDRLILVHGNHEDLFVDLLKKSMPEDTDFHNGTVKTFCAIAGADIDLLYPDSNYWFERSWQLSEAGLSDEQIVSVCQEQLEKYWKAVKKKVKESNIGKFILEKGNWVNFVETQSYIIVHGFLPIRLNRKMSGYVYSYFRNWRTKATNKQWEDARWSNFRYAYELVDNGLFDEEYRQGKRLICGHTPARYFREYYFGSDGPFTDHIGHDIVETPKLIAIDACTFVSGQVNVFTFEE